MATRRRLWLLPFALFVPLAVWLLLRHFTVPDDSLSGVVTADGQPVAGAQVRIQTTATITKTDAEGRFHIPRAKGERLTAWKAGYFIGGVPLTSAPFTVALTPLPDHDADDYEWVDPAPQHGGLHNCAHCHSEIYREWNSSAHSRAASGKHFRNLYEGTDWNDQPDVGWSLLGQHPNGAAVCSACHAPASPPLSEMHQLTGIAVKGVHCDYCHKIADASDSKLGTTFGRFNLELLRPAPAKEGEEQRQLFFGPLDDVDRGDDAFAPVYKQSRYCASCHEGIVFGVPVYTTYSEWLASPAKQKGTQCQDCHMKPTGTMTNFAPGAGGKERDPKTLGNHRFVDGSLPDMLRRAVQTTAKLELHGDEVRATVGVVARGVGHRVPTGFIDRHLVLIVEGLTARGKTRLPLEGPRLPDLAGEPLVGKGGKVYAKLLKDQQGHSPAPFWRADPTPSDNRLSPEERDETVFVFPADVERIRVRVLYRRFWPAVARQKKWPDDDVILVEEAYQR